MKIPKLKVSACYLAQAESKSVLFDSQTHKDSPQATVRTGALKVTGSRDRKGSRKYVEGEVKAGALSKVELPPVLIISKLSFSFHRKP